MSKLGTRIDFKRHEAKANVLVIKFQYNSSGHYFVPLTILAGKNGNVVFHLINLLLLSNEEKKKKAVKLHGQLCHASKDRLVKATVTGLEPTSVRLRANWLWVRGHFVALMTKEIANHWKNTLRAQR